MLCKIISGGQTGVDQAALRAAVRQGLETGGTAPKGFLTEDGKSPELARYGLIEHPSDKYPLRTFVNIRDSDLTLVISEIFDGGSKLTVKLAMDIRKPVFHILADDMEDNRSMDEIINWIRRRKHAVINVSVTGKVKARG